MVMRGEVLILCGPHIKDALPCRSKSRRPRPDAYPLGVHLTSYPGGRRAVIDGVNLDAAIKVHGGRQTGISEAALRTHTLGVSRFEMTWRMGGRGSRSCIPTALTVKVGPPNVYRTSELPRATVSPMPFGGTQPLVVYIPPISRSCDMTTSAKRR
jgi:hypothetical protein